MKILRIAILGLFTLSTAPVSAKVKIVENIRHQQANNHKTTLIKKPIHNVGMASWYGYKSVRKNPRTSNGEPFNQNRMTAAHKTLEFGTKVKVTNLNNNKSVIVTITDRGPFVRGRIIDLAKAAANKIDLVDAGITRVALTVL